jgi:hypothetical protein
MNNNSNSRMSGSNSGTSGSDSSMSQNLVLGSKVMNCQVKDQQNQTLGTISNVVINPESGHIRYAVVNAKGKKVAVPWSALNFNKSSSSGGTPQCTLNTTKGKLANAPKFDANNLASLSSRTTEEPIYAYYEVLYFPDMMSTGEQGARNRSGSASSSNSTAGSGSMSGSTSTGSSGYGSSGSGSSGTGTSGSSGGSIGSTPSTTGSPGARIGSLSGHPRDGFQIWLVAGTSRLRESSVSAAANATLPLR